MMRLTSEDVAAMIALGVMILITMELMCWAITGAYIGR